MPDSSDEDIEEWGTPKADDATAAWEHDMNEVFKAYQRIVNQEGPNIANRPMGSEPVAWPEQDEDYLRVRQDTQGVLAYIKQEMQRSGEMGIEESLRRLEKMEKRLRGRREEP